MSDPFVSVIVAVKNGERFLPAALASIRSQGYKPLEIVVVNGLSIDRTELIAMAAADVRYFRQDDDGLANARNHGIREARGELIAFLDADDEWLPGKLRRQVDQVLVSPDTSGNITHVRFRVEPSYSSQADHVGHRDNRVMIGYTPGTLVARKDLLERVGRFDPAFSVACDADWFARLLDSGESLALLPDVLLVKRIHGENISLQLDRARHETMLVLRSSMKRKRAAHASSPDRAFGRDFQERMRVPGDPGTS